MRFVDPNKFARDPLIKLGWRQEPLSLGESLGGGDRQREGTKELPFIEQSCCQHYRLWKQDLRWKSEREYYSFYLYDLLLYIVTFVIAYSRSKTATSS